MCEAVYNQLFRSDVLRMITLAFIDESVNVGVMPGTRTLAGNAGKSGCEIGIF